MNWDAVGAIAEMLGTVVVFASLVYLAIQIRQNTKALRANAIDAVTSHQTAELHWSSELSELFVKAREDPSSLSPAEKHRLRAWLNASLRARQNEFFQYNQGLLDENVWQSSRVIIPRTLGMEWALNLWRDNLSDAFTPDFRRVVEEEIELYRGRT